MEDRQPDPGDLAAVADRSVEEDSCNAASVRGCRNDAAAVRAAALAADREHDHIARRGPRHRLVKREIVAGRTLRGERRPEDARFRPRRLEPEENEDAALADRRDRRRG